MERLLGYFGKILVAFFPFQQNQYFTYRERVRDRSVTFLNDELVICYTKSVGIILAHPRFHGIQIF